MALKPLSLSARLVAVAALASLSLQPLAFADRGRGGGGDHERGYRDSDRDDHYRGRSADHRRDDRRHRRDDWRDDRRDDWRDDRRSSYRDYDYGYRAPVVRFSYSSRPSYGYSSSYSRRDYDDYRPRYAVGGNYHCHNRTVYINDYDRYGLYDPPRGYHWVRDDDTGDAILASAATGAIIGLVIGAIAYGN